MSGDLALFDARPLLRQPQAIKELGVELDDLAFLYTGTALGNCSGIRFMLTRDEARIWCDSDLSRGAVHGTSWAYFWTSVATFVGVFGRSLDLTGYTDDGSWDHRIASLGLHKIGLGEIATTLRPYGIAVTRTTSDVGGGLSAAEEEEEHG